jgi:hypothetical protein
VLDTRNGTGAPAGKLQGGQSLNLALAGVQGIPSSHVSAVVLNVTVTNPAAAGYLTVYPSGTTPPVVSNLNFVAGQTVPNLVEVALSASGSVSFFNSAGATDVVADVQGWVGDNTNSWTPDGLYNPLVPQRILDTRTGNGAPAARLGPNQSLNLQVSGRGGTQGVPATGVSAVTMNVTVTNPTAASYLTVFPTGATQPLASNLNFSAGQTVPNRVAVKLGTGGQVTIFNSAGYVDVIADVNGYFTDTNGTAGGAAFIGITPYRVFDSRGGSQLCGGCVFSFMVDQTTIFHSAFVLNVTATNGNAASYLTLYPDDGTHGATPPPLASDLNFVAYQTVPNLCVVAVGPSPGLNVFNAAGSVDVILDEDGFYGPMMPAPPASQYTPRQLTYDSVNQPTSPTTSLHPR